MDTYHIYTPCIYVIRIHEFKPSIDGDYEPFAYYNDFDPSSLYASRQFHCFNHLLRGSSSLMNVPLYA